MSGHPAERQKHSPFSGGWQVFTDWMNRCTTSSIVRLWEHFAKRKRPRYHHTQSAVSPKDFINEDKM